MEWIFIIALGTGIVYATTILLFLVGWLRNRRFHPSGGIPETKISVLIPVRNEEKNLPKLLKDLLGQSFPQNQFEVIVISDHSTDSTESIIASCHKKHSNFRYILMNEPCTSGKKTAIEEGMKQARHDLVITTDGDCRVPENWLLSFAEYYEKHNPVMILGPVLFHNRGGFLSQMIQLEQFSLLGTTAGSCGVNMPVMSGGANLAFKKRIFYEVSNPLYRQTPSGDDMFLLLNTKILNSKHIRFIKSTDAAVFTQPPADFDTFWEQRKRWVSKSRFYADPEVLFTGGLVFLISFLLLLLLAGSFFSLTFARAFILLFLLKSIPDLLLLLSVTSFFKKKRLMLYFLPAEILYFAYVTLAGLLGFFSPYYWKGRKWKKEKRKF